jgi:hypothetical protein
MVLVLVLACKSQIGPKCVRRDAAAAVAPAWLQLK